jgi:hypothetical protein
LEVREGKAEAPIASSCSPPLPTLPPHGDDNDDEDGPPLTCGSSAEAAPFEVAALVVA